MLVVAGNNPEFGWRQIAPNGSGLGLAAVDGNQALDGPQDVALYDLANRSVTTNRLLTMPTPGEAFAVAIANGYGLVADGSAGLQVVNYIAADTGTTPPTLAVTTNQPAGTAQEGRFYRVTAHVTDDVQVRAVEFWIDGALVADRHGVPVRVPAGDAAAHASRPRSPCACAPSTRAATSPRRPSRPSRSRPTSRRQS